MNICVLGWYYNPSFYKTLESIHSKYPVFVVAHKSSKSHSLPTKLISNIGLEWHGYDYYLKNIWDEKSDVFFTQDDTEVHDAGIFDKIAEIKKDVSYIFRTERDCKGNAGAHGRAIFISKRFLKYIKNMKCSCKWSRERGEVYHTGFWYDYRNFGETRENDVAFFFTSATGPHRDYNKGIEHFDYVLGVLKNKDNGFVFGHDIFEEYGNGYKGYTGIEAVFQEIHNLVSVVTIGKENAT